jgi:hypothetical protein
MSLPTSATEGLPKGLESNPVLHAQPDEAPVDKHVKPLKDNKAQIGQFAECRNKARQEQISEPVDANFIIGHIFVLDTSRAISFLTSNGIQESRAAKDSQKVENRRWTSLREISANQQISFIHLESLSSRFWILNARFIQRPGRSFLPLSLLSENSGFRINHQPSVSVKGELCGFCRSRSAPITPRGFLHWCKLDSAFYRWNFSINQRLCGMIWEGSEIHQW